MTTATDPKPGYVEGQRFRPLTPAEHEELKLLWRMLIDHQRLRLKHARLALEDCRDWLDAFEQSVLSRPNHPETKP